MRFCNSDKPKRFLPCTAYASDISIIETSNNLAQTRTTTSFHGMETDLNPPALAALRKILDAADLENRRMAAVSGLTASQALVLRQIGSGPGMTPSAVATALRFGQATITNIVDKLAAAGLVTRTRSERDKRQILVQATPVGLQRLQDIPFPLQMRFGQGYDQLPRWEQAMLLAALERIGGLISEPEPAGDNPA